MDLQQNWKDIQMQQQALQSSNGLQYTSQNPSANSYQGGGIDGGFSGNGGGQGGPGNGYDSISNTTRKALVQLVTEQNLSVRKASKILQIKYTTAKALVQKFRNTGNIDRQRARRMTFEDDQREKFRKDLIKALPIEVEEDSEDERWGFTTMQSNPQASFGGMTNYQGLNPNCGGTTLVHGGSFGVPQQQIMPSIQHGFTEMLNPNQMNIIPQNNIRNLMGGVGSSQMGIDSYGAGALQGNGNNLYRVNPVSVKSSSQHIFQNPFQDQTLATPHQRLDFIQLPQAEFPSQNQSASGASNFLARPFTAMNGAQPQQNHSVQHAMMNSNAFPGMSYAFSPNERSCNNELAKRQQQLKSVDVTQPQPIIQQQMSQQDFRPFSTTQINGIGQAGKIIPFSVNQAINQNQQLNPHQFSSNLKRDHELHEAEAAREIAQQPQQMMYLPPHPGQFSSSQSLQNIRAESKAAVEGGINMHRQEDKAYQGNLYPLNQQVQGSVNELEGATNGQARSLLLSERGSIIQRNTNESLALISSSLPSPQIQLTQGNAGVSQQQPSLNLNNQQKVSAQTQKITNNGQVLRPVPVTPSAVSKLFYQPQNQASAGAVSQSAAALICPATINQQILPTNFMLPSVVNGFGSLANTSIATSNQESKPIAFRPQAENMETKSSSVVEDMQQHHPCLSRGGLSSQFGGGQERNPEADNRNNHDHLKRLRQTTTATQFAEIEFINKKRTRKGIEKLLNRGAYGLKVESEEDPYLISILKSDRQQPLSILMIPDSLSGFQQDGLLLQKDGLLNARLAEMQVACQQNNINRIQSTINQEQENNPSKAAGGIDNGILKQGGLNERHATEGAFKNGQSNFEEGDFPLQFRFSHYQASIASYLEGKDSEMREQ